MNRDLAILGLREGASKEQIQVAYEYRLRRYKAADFTDDPDYVWRKSEQLKNAFEAAYAAAGNTSSDETPTQDEARNYEPKDYQPREYEPEKYDHDDFERGRKNAAEKGEHQVKFSELNKLKGIAKSMGDTLVDNVKSFTEGSKVQTERGDQPFPNLAKHESNLQMRDRITRERDSWEETTESVELPDTEETYNPVHTSSTTGSSAGSGVLKLAGVIIPIILVIASSFMTMCDDTSIDDDSSVYEQTYVYNGEHDMTVNNMAQDIQEQVSALDSVGAFPPSSDTDAEIEQAGNEFAKKYFHQDSIQDLGMYFHDIYGDYLSEKEKTNTEEIIEEILEFFQFPASIAIEGCINPYNGETMATQVDYLHYLCAYYDEHGLPKDIYR